MRSLFGICIGLMITALVSGCAMTGQKFGDEKSRPARTATLGPGQGRIYFYRTMLLGAAVQPEVKVNDEVVGRAVPNGYFFVDRKPGSYVVSTSTEVERKLSLVLEPGQVRYVKLSLSVGLLVGHVYPELVDSDVAEKEMSDVRYTGPN